MQLKVLAATAKVALVVAVEESKKAKIIPPVVIKAVSFFQETVEDRKNILGLNQYMNFLSFQPLLIKMY